MEKDSIISSNPRHISRIDQEGKKTHGWYVRIFHKAKAHLKFFSDLSLGGRAASLTAALDWRDKKENELGRPRTDRYVVTKARTNTGIVGVSLNRHNRYEVTWVTPAGKQGKTSYSATKHGQAKALAMAMEKRAQKEAERLAASSR